MREQITPNLYTIIIFSIAFFVALIYLLYFRKKKESFTDAWMFFKIIAYSTVLILFLFVFALEMIVIYITMGEETGTESWIFLILNVLLLGMYINILGFRSKVSINSIRYLILFVLVMFSLSGFGYLGVLIEFREPISDYLFYRFYQSNSTHGIFFFVLNILLFTLIYFISYMTESEVE